MGAAFDAEAWHDFAVMVGGASAALAGLLGVTLSISVEQILANATLPRRAGAALVMTISPLAVAVALLLPGQSRGALGTELVIIGALAGAALAAMVVVPGPSEQQSRTQWALGTALPIGLLVVPIILAGTGVLTGALGGLYWLAPAVLAGLLGGVLQAWVLLIEIRR